MTAMRTAVAMVVFTREDDARRVFERVAEARPPKLFVIADGPRPDHPEDVERCAATRAVFDEVDWDCEVHRRFSDDNLGCGRSVAEGVFTAASVVALADRLSVEMPICAAVDAVLNRGAGLDDVINGLLSRPVPAEWRR